MFARLSHKWKTKMQINSRLVVMVSIGLFFFIILIEIFNFIFSGTAAKCVNVDTEIPEVCTQSFLINKVMLSFTFSVFFLLSVLDGLFNENLYELYSAMFISSLSTGYYVYRFSEPYINDFFDYALLIVPCACQIFFIVIGFPLHNEYLWKLYRKVGADKTFRNIYKHYLIYVCILKVFVMFALINATSYGKGFVSTGLALVINIGEIVLCILILVAGFFSAKYEHRTFFMVYMFSLILPLVFIIYSFWINIAYIIFYPTYETATMFIISSATGILTIGLDVLLLILSIGTIRNFGHGLKGLEYLKKNQPEMNDNTMGDDGEVYEYIENQNNDDDFSVLDVIRNTYGLNSNVK